MDAVTVCFKYRHSQHVRWASTGNVVWKIVGRSYHEISTAIVVEYRLLLEDHPGLVIELAAEDTLTLVEDPPC